MKQNAYSLIEVLTVLVIMGVLTIIGVIAFDKFTKDNKANLNSNLEKTVIEAANAYCTDSANKTACGIYPDTTTKLISLDTLVKATLLEGELKNNLTNNDFCLTETKVTVTPTGLYTYDYSFNIETDGDYQCTP